MRSAIMTSLHDRVHQQNYRSVQLIGGKFAFERAATWCANLPLAVLLKSPPTISPIQASPFPSMCPAHQGPAPRTSTPPSSKPSSPPSTCVTSAIPCAMHFFATAVERLPSRNGRQPACRPTAAWRDRTPNRKQQRARNMLKGIFHGCAHVDNHDLVGVETLLGLLRGEAHKRSIFQGFLLRHHAPFRYSIWDRAYAANSAMLTRVLAWKARGNARAMRL